MIAKRIVQLVFLIGVVTSCNPVQKVLSTPKYFSEVKDTVLARGYCLNDTVFKTMRDTVETIRDTTILDTFTVFGTPDCDVDTVFKQSGIQFTIVDGVVRIKIPQKIKDKVITKTDKAIVQDVAQLKALERTVNHLRLENSQKDLEISELEKTINQYRLYIGAAVLVLVLLVFLFKR